MGSTQNTVSIYRKGERVRHPKMPQWGLGEVLSRSNGNEVRVFFVGIGFKALSLSFVQLEKVPALLAESPLLDNLIPDIDQSDTQYRNFEALLTQFQTAYPEGFYDANYVANERQQKEAHHQEASELLGAKVMSDLLAEGRADEVCQRVLTMVSQTKMVFPNEKSALKKALSEAAAQQDFGNSLHEVLYGKAKFRARIDSFTHCLIRLGINKWQLATYILHTLQPDRHMLVKPSVIQQSALQSGYNIQYANQVNWKTYDRILGFASYLRNELKAAGMKPRDLIDVQSFIWCVTLNKASQA